LAAAPARDRAIMSRRLAPWPLAAGAYYSIFSSSQAAPGSESRIFKGLGAGRTELEKGQPLWQAAHNSDILYNNASQSSSFFSLLRKRSYQDTDENATNTENLENLSEIMF